ncbi:hypothetical protein [Burkholderia sp. Tr-20390]|uniref:hypothetical protein n=1 Tax=Burkholderia sp. Tr-20390 TaxID=2703904 RepID=UPI001981EFCD|nr:hypothetical protein [Burkholderia sp. Tr-20390]MBN3735105.1 hypothetical protein [Burkholderia sp. Tr-20390]
MQVKAPPVRPLLTLPLLAPAICKAEAGELGGVVDLAFYLLIFFVVWALLTGAFSWLLRKQPPGKRGGLTLLFFSLPVLVLFGWGALDQFLGTPGNHVDGTADRPIVVAGVSFPAGSEVQYVQTGGGFWNRQPIGAQSDTGVRMGALEIKGLLRQDFDVDVWSVTLTRPQTIDGWSCAPDSVVMRWQPDVTQRQLYQCELAAPRTIGPIDWPAVTHVNRSNDGNWMLSWLGVDHGTPTAKAIGIRFGAMRATYGPALDLKTWSANFADSDTVIGEYLFSSDSTTDATWIAGNDFRIEGKGRNAKTGEAVNCVLLQPAQHRFAPCQRHAG